MASRHPFDQDTIKLLASLGYQYLVIDKVNAIAFARKSAVEKEKLDFLEFEQLEIDSLKPHHFLTLYLEEIIAE